MKYIRPKRARRQNWKTFLRNHAAEIWAQVASPERFSIIFSEKPSFDDP
jgi:hypothetical protein